MHYVSRRMILHRRSYDLALISFPSKVLFLLSEKGDTLRKGALSLKQTLNSTKKKNEGKGRNFL